MGGRLATKMGLPVVAVGLALAAARLAGASVAGHLVPGHRAALATAPPLLVAGIGSGFVILSNQALTLAEVPPVAGGSAAGVPQAGQRIGSAVGIAAGGSVFFSTSTATHGDYARAFQDGLVIIIALVAVWRRSWFSVMRSRFSGVWSPGRNLAGQLLAQTLAS
jgi:hypothetical protein